MEYCKLILPFVISTVVSIILTYLAIEGQKKMNDKKDIQEKPKVNFDIDLAKSIVGSVEMSVDKDDDDEKMVHHLVQSWPTPR